MSLAKQFEKNVATQLNNIKGTYVYRLSDLVNKFGVSNPCDYFCFYKNTFFLLEMKTTEQASLPLKNISDFQYTSMLEASSKKGIKSYFIVWWYSKGITRAIPVGVIKDIRETNKKSIRYDYKDKRIIDIDGIKKKMYFD
jgi:penicillin-binding protein-related factor A (putative recombinase)